MFALCETCAVSWSASATAPIHGVTAIIHWPNPVFLKSRAHSLAHTLAQFNDSAICAHSKLPSPPQSSDTIGLRPAHKRNHFWWKYIYHWYDLFSVGYLILSTRLCIDDAESWVIRREMFSVRQLENENTERILSKSRFTWIRIQMFCGEANDCQNRISVNRINWQRWSAKNTFRRTYDICRADIIASCIGTTNKQTNSTGFDKAR